jgi:hypothetical protein
MQKFQGNPTHHDIHTHVYSTRLLPFQATKLHCHERSKTSFESHTKESAIGVGNIQTWGENPNFTNLRWPPHCQIDQEDNKFKKVSASLIELSP